MNGDPIDEYLAALRAGLRTSPARTAEILAEAEDHLRESAAVALQAGHLSEAAAQRAAIEAFGPVKAVTRAHRPSLAAFTAAAALRRRASRPTVTAYAVEAGLTACQLLGGYLLFVALLGGQFGPLLGSLVATRSSSVWPYTGPGVGVFYGCVATGVLLAVGALVARQRRHLPVRLPRGLSSLVAVLALAALGFAEYRFFAGDVMGSLHASYGIGALVLCSQWAAVLMGAAWALRTLVSLVQWALTGLRGTGKAAPPESADLAPAG